VTAGAVHVPRARLIVAVSAVFVAVTLLWLSRNYTFYFDEWTFIQTAPDWTWLTYLQPHNVHPSMLFRLAYAGLLDTVGLRSYVPYMGINLALHALNVVLLFEVVRRRNGELVALVSAALLAVLGAGWEDLLWAFQLAWLASVALGLVMLLLLEQPPKRGGAALVAGVATASLMFSGVGLIFVVAAIVRLAATPARRSELVWMVPVVIAAAAWYVALGNWSDSPTPQPTTVNVVLIAAYVAWGLGAAAAGLIGAGGWVGPVALVLAAAAVAWTWSRQPPDPVALGVGAGLLTFYLVAGVARANIGYQQAGASRYIYEGSLLWILLLADAARHLPWHGTWRPALVACVFLACFNSGLLLFEFTAAKTAQMQRQQADLQALDAARGRRCLSAFAYADPLVMPAVNRPQQYYRAIDRYGDPVAGLPVIDRTDFLIAYDRLVQPGCS
jgi:hypothetical protein